MASLIKLFAVGLVIEIVGDVASTVKVRVWVALFPTSSRTVIDTVWEPSERADGGINVYLPLEFIVRELSTPSMVTVTFCVLVSITSNVIVGVASLIKLFAVGLVIEMTGSVVSIEKVRVWVILFPALSRTVIDAVWEPSDKATEGVNV